MMPACAEMNAAMQELVGVSFETSEQHEDESKAKTSGQHRETSKARINRDTADAKAVLSHFRMRSPFGPFRS